jgi:hypothetical protein
LVIAPAMSVYSTLLSMNEYDPKMMKAMTTTEPMMILGFMQTFPP